MNLEMKVASDCGNNEQAMIFDGEFYKQPSAISKISNIPFNDNPDESTMEFIISKLFKQIVISVNSEKVNPGRYLIGENALESGDSYENINIGVEKKYQSKIPILMTIGMIAAKAVQDAYKENKELNETIKVKADLCTGLPLTEYSSDRALAFSEAFGNKPYDILVYLGKSVSVKVELTFDSVQVYPESSPVVFSLTDYVDGTSKTEEIFKDYNDRYAGKDDREAGEVVEKYEGDYFEDKRLLHIDIGEGTTEYPITDGLVPNQKLVKGSNNGIGYAVEAITSDFADKVSLPSIRRHNISDILKNKRHKYFSTVSALVEIQLEKQAADIMKYAQLQLNNVNNEINTIVVYGGGSILLKPFLLPKLEKISQDRDVKLLYIPEEFATTIYVEGLNKMLNSTIFENNRKKYKLSVAK